MLVAVALAWNSGNEKRVLMSKVSAITLYPDRKTKVRKKQKKQKNTLTLRSSLLTS
jgi:hypothetical protein